MKTLFINIASQEGYLAVCSATEVLAEVHLEPRVPEQAVVQACTQVCESAGTTLNTIQQIACIVGPGGFSSLRIGVTIPNTICAVTGVPIAGIHLAELYTIRSKEPNILWLHSTKKTQVFVQGFGTYAQVFPELVCMELNDVLANFITAPTWCGELIADHEQALIAQGWQSVELLPLATVLPTLLVNTNFTPQVLEPWYGRAW